MLFLAGIICGIILAVTMIATGWWVIPLALTSLIVALLLSIIVKPLQWIGVMSRERADRIIRSVILFPAIV